MENSNDDDYEKLYSDTLRTLDDEIKSNMELLDGADGDYANQLRSLNQGLETSRKDLISSHEKYQSDIAKLYPARKPNETEATETRTQKMTAKKAPEAKPTASHDSKMEYVDFLRIERKSRSKKRRTGLEEQITTHWKDEKNWNMVRGSGWFAAPKLLPVVLAILDELAPKGIKLGSTYLALLSLTWEGVPITTIKDESEAAMLAGFAGKNRKYAFRQRMVLLEELGMIRVVGNPGEWQQVFIKEPVPAIQELSIAGKLATDSPWSMFLWHYITHRSL